MLNGRPQLSIRMLDVHLQLTIHLQLSIRMQDHHVHLQLTIHLQLSIRMLDDHLIGELHSPASRILLLRAGSYS
jgi:hypothetical protein